MTATVMQDGVVYGRWRSIFAAIAIAIFAAQVALFWPFTVDDAFITFRYIRQFVAGNGLVFNIGERVEGYSNFLWLMTLAPFYALGLDVVIVSKLLGVLLALLALWLTMRLAKPTGYGWLAGLLLAASAPFAIWTVGGLETMLFACLFAASALAFISEEEEGRGVLSGLLFALLALTRPEGILFGLLAATFRVAKLWRERRLPMLRDWMRLGLWLGPVLVHFVWRLSYYGYPLPNTVYAKSLGLHPRAFLEGAYYLYDSAVALGGILALIVGGLTVLLHMRMLRYAYLLAAVVAYAAFVLVGGGDWMPGQRFLVHVLPAIAVLMALGIARVGVLLSARHALRAAGALAFAQIILLLGLAIEARMFDSALRSHMILDASNLASASRPRYLLAKLRPGDAVAVTDAGVIGFLLPLDVRVIDMFGLTDSHIAHLKPQFPNGLLGRGDGFGKWDVDYVLSQTPKVIQAHVIGLELEGGSTRYLSGNTSNQLLFDDPRFQQHYRPASESPELTGLFERVSP